MHGYAAIFAPLSQRDSIFVTFRSYKMGLSFKQILYFKRDSILEGLRRKEEVLTLYCLPL